MIEIIAFYEFCELGRLRPLQETRQALRDLLHELGVRGTIILADEGFNGMVCGEPSAIENFVESAGSILGTTLVVKSSFHDTAPLRRVDVKIKREIVTLKRSVDMTLGENTHVSAQEWNQIISDPDTFVLDTRNDYEYRTGSFARAVNPGTASFSELPDYVARNLDPRRHTKIAMFCTGGIRCEKFVPYLKQLGFEKVYQLDGGILNYLENIPADESLWQGECFVFDERVTVGADLRKGREPDRSHRLDRRRNPLYKPVE